MAFLEHLSVFGPFVSVLPSDTHAFSIENLEQFLRPGTQVYCCGPARLINSAAEWFTAKGRREDLHVELFSPSDKSRRSEPSEGELDSFEVELRRSGRTVVVQGGETILDAVRHAVADAHSSCEMGFCGSCETTVIQGVPSHHDTILTPAEQAASKTVMICVGRSKTPRLVLDL